MNDKIDINDLEWVAGVADDLDEIADELKEVNKLLKELDDYLEDNNFKKEIYFGFVDQSKDLDKIKDNVQIIRRAAKSPESNYGYTADMSIASLVDLCIDQPFHKKMEKTVARLAKADISNYTAENSGGIVVEEETWEAGASINSPSTRVVKLVTPKRLTINDILSSPFSKAMRKKQYQEYLKLLYPDLSDKSIEAIDTKLLYDMYLKSQLDIADFDYLTQIEEGLNGLRKLGACLGLATIAIVLSPATAALLGTGATVITVSSTAVNGFLSIVDVISLISGKDINGNELTKAERDNLLASVVIDGAFLAGSIYSKIQLNNISKEKNVIQLRYKTTSGLTLEATQGKTTTILGRYSDDTKYIIDELQLPKSTEYIHGNEGGFNLLNVPDELYINPNQFWIEYNKPFLDNAIQRGDDIVMATKPTIDSLYISGTNQLTGFGREYYYLLENGYYFDVIKNCMIKK